MKKVVSALLCLSFLFSLFAAPASAEAAEAVEPRWSDPSRVTAKMDCSDGYANCSVRINGGTNTSSIDCSFELRKIYNSNTYGVVKYESMSVDGDSLSWGKEIKIDPGYTYKFIVHATMYRGSDIEPQKKEIEQYYA